MRRDVPKFLTLTLPLLSLLAWAIPSCEAPSEEEASPPLPSVATQRYVLHEAPPPVWRVFEGDGDFQPLAEPVPGGLIEWTRGSVVGEGRGIARGAAPQDALMARRAARLLAARNALLVAGGVAVGPGGSFRDVADGTIRLDAVLRDFHEIRNDFDPASRTAVVAVRLPMYGARGIVRIADLGLRPAKRQWPWSATGDAPSADAPSPDAPSPDAPPTSPGATSPPPGGTAAPKLIVLDLRGTGYAPALLPRFLTPDGQCVFDAADLGAEELAWRPAATHVQYAPSGGSANAAPPHSAPAAAMPGPTTGAAFTDSAARSFPGALVLTDCKARPGQAGCIVLSEPALAYLRFHPSARELFRSGRVVIVTGGR
jgi:hypothetical protein